MLFCSKFKIASWLGHLLDKDGVWNVSSDKSIMNCRLQVYDTCLLFSSTSPSLTNPLLSPLGDNSRHEPGRVQKQLNPLLVLVKVYSDTEGLPLPITVLNRQLIRLCISQTQCFPDFFGRLLVLSKSVLNVPVDRPSNCSEICTARLRALTSM